MDKNTEHYDPIDHAHVFYDDDGDRLYRYPTRQTSWLTWTVEHAVAVLLVSFTLYMLWEMSRLL